MIEQMVNMPTYEAYKDSGVEWLGEIPAHWQVKALKHIAFMKSGETISPDQFTEDGFPVFGGNGFRGYTKTFTNEGCFVLIGRQGALCGNVNYAEGQFFASEHAIVVYPLNKENYFWLGESIRLADLNRFSQSAAQPGIAVNVIKNVLFPYPPLPEQTAIADFLDRKTAQIDQAVAIKEQQIALLKEHKQILIQNAVTRGLDPNAPMRDSGVEWIGEIPAHWEIRRSKFVFTQRKELAKPGDVQLSATQAYGVIPQDEYESKIDRRVVKIQFHLEKRKHVEIDDFVISMRSFQGGLERAWSEGCIRSSYVVLRPLIKLNASYYGYLFKSSRYISALQSTANFIRDGQDLNFENFSMVDLPIAPLEEQCKIADYLDYRICLLNKSTELLQQQIDKLKEYKTTLINSAVTGKIRVPEVVV
jgi:type I restriction enzyme S subunit